MAKYHVSLFSCFLFLFDSTRYWDSLRSITEKWDKAKIYLDNAQKLVPTFEMSPIDVVMKRVETLRSLSKFLSHCGHLNEGCMVGRVLVDETRKYFGDSHETHARALASLSYILQKQGHLSESLIFCEKSHKLLLQLLGANHPDIAESLSTLGGITRAQGHLDLAVEHHKRALNIRLHLFGNTHPLTEASLDVVGYILSAQGNHNEALEYCKRALDTRIRLFGEDHPDTATSTSSTGVAYDNKGDHNEGLKHTIEHSTLSWACLERIIPILPQCSITLVSLYLKKTTSMRHWYITEESSIFAFVCLEKITLTQQHHSTTSGWLIQKPIIQMRH